MLKTPFTVYTPTGARVLVTPSPQVARAVQEFEYSVCDAATGEHRYGGNLLLLASSTRMQVEVAVLQSVA